MPTAGGQPSPSKGGGVTSPGLLASGATDVVTQRRVITSPPSTQADLLLPSDPPPLSSRYALSSTRSSGKRVNEISSREWHRGDLRVKGAEAHNAPSLASRLRMPAFAVILP